MGWEAGIETILVYKFPKLTEEELEAMFTISDLKKTKVYQETLQEGRQEGERQKAQSLILRQLTRRLGKLDSRLTQAVKKLEIKRLDELAEALLDFQDMNDLKNWLKNLNNNAMCN